METMNKKTLEQLAVYLPYGLQACGASEIWTIIGASQRKIIMDCGLWQSAIPYDDFSIDYDVLLSPLSDYADIKLSESLEANEYTRAEIYKYAHGDMELGKLRYDAILTMARNHIDIFNWIPKGLAVNLNTITMITKQIAGLLYSFSYQLQDNEGNVWDIMAVHTTSFRIFCPSGERFFDNVFCDFSEIGSTYKILAREMDLTKPIEGVGVPIVQLAKIAFPNYNWEVGDIHKDKAYSDIGVFWLDGLCFLRESIYSDTKPVPNQLALFNWLYTHKFNLDFPEGTTTNLI